MLPKAALRLVLHTTYPTLQRTFVVIDVISTLRAFIHRQAQFARSPSHPPTPGRLLPSRASGGAISPLRTRRLRRGWAVWTRQQINLVPGLFSRAADKGTGNEATAACLPFLLVAFLAWPQRRGERAVAALSPPVLLFISTSDALSETRTRIHFPALFVV